VTPAVPAVAAAVAVMCATRGASSGARRLNVVAGADSGLASRSRRRGGVVVASAAGAAAFCVLAGRPLLGCAAALVVGAAVRRVVRGRAVRRAEAVRAAVPEFAYALAGELRAGRDPTNALVAAGAATPPVLAPVVAVVVATGSLGGDVAAALRSAAGVPGADALGRLAACWQVAVELGAAPGPAVARLAHAERDRQRHRAAVVAELAGVRATAGLLVALPVVGLILGMGMGAHPVGFLVATPAGAGCLSVGVALAAAGLAWTDRLAARALAAA